MENGGAAGATAMDEEIDFAAEDAEADALIGIEFL